MEGDEPVREALAAGTGCVVFLGHLGDWDSGGAWSSGHLAPVTTVAERLEPEEVFRDFLEFRESLGMTIIPLTGGGDPFVALKQAIGRGEFVALLADRDLTHNGVEVDLCGHRARMAKGPAVLSVMTKAPLFTATVWFEDAPALPSGKRVVIRMTPVATPEEGVDPRQGPGDGPGRAPTSSGRRSSGIPRTGTCCSGSSSTTSTTASAPEPSALGGDVVRLGIVCPYSFDMPGGVQYHVRDLAEVFLAQGHDVSVLAPANDRTPLPPYVVSAGRAIPVKYNGSTARLNIGPDDRGPGDPVGGERRLRPRPPARADHPERLRAGPVGGRGPDRGDLPHLDAALALLPDRLPAGPAQPREDHRAHRRVRGRPAHRHHPPRRRRRRHPQRRLRAPVRPRGAPRRVDGYPGTPDHRLPRPDGGAAQGYAGARRRAAGGASRGPRAAGPRRRSGRRATRSREGLPARGGRARASSSARSPTRTRRGCSSRSTSTSPRTPAGRASGSSSSRR